MAAETSSRQRLSPYVKGSQSLLDQIDYLSLVGKSTRFSLGKHKVIAIFNLKHSATRPNQVGRNTQFPVQFFCQTGCSGLVVSLATIGYLALIHDLLTPP